MEVCEICGSTDIVWVEEARKNLMVLENTIEGMSRSAKATLDAAGFMRLSKDQASIKTFPE